MPATVTMVTSSWIASVNAKARFDLRVGYANTSREVSILRR